MKVKKMSKFMKSYLTVVAILAVLLIVGAILLWNFLKAYESTRPKQLADELYGKYFLSGDYTGILKEAGVEDSLFDGDEAICASIRDRIGEGELDYFTVTSDDESKVKYAVTANDRQIASFTLKKSDKKAAFGLKYYVLDSAELLGEPGKKITVNVPAGYGLFINGRQVGDNYMVADDLVVDIDANVPDGIEKIKYRQYCVDRLFAEPELSAKAPSGVETSVVPSKADGVYTAQLVYDEVLKAEQSEYAVKAARAYTLYMSNDAEFSEVGKYLDKKSDIYDMVRTCEVNWVRDHNGHRLFDEHADEFVKYSDDFFSCRITLKETIIRSGFSGSNGEYTESVDLIFYFLRTDGKWLVYDIVTN